MHTCPFDVALGQGRVKLNALVQILECIGILAAKISKCTTHIVRESFVFAQVAELKRFIECR